MKILVQVKNDKYFPVIKEKGDWIDLYAAEDIELLPSTMIDPITNTVSFQSVKIDLGVAMALPKGFEAHIVPRSSTFKNFKIVQSNSLGIIDNTYSGNDDEWKFPAISLERTVIKKGDRICQFRIQLSQKATIWQKIKWLFTSKIKFEWVDNLDSYSRGGFGSTGK